MARFFIDRPIFAWVIAIVIMVAGAISITQLPIARYPTIAPPTVSISAFYPGASAQVVEDSVTQIIEQNMKGLDGLLYMSATSQSNGRANITLTFASGTCEVTRDVHTSPRMLISPVAGAGKCWRKKSSSSPAACPASRIACLLSGA